VGRHAAAQPARHARTKARTAGTTSVRPTPSIAFPRWLRTPALPVLVVALTVWGVSDTFHLLGGGEADSVQRTDADVKSDLSALAANQIVPPAGYDGGYEKVSRATRANSDSAPSDTALTDSALDGSATALPARPSLPKVQAGRTVLGTWVRPSAGGMSSCFCMRWGEMHEGIDLAGPLGSPIVAVGDGVVVEAGPSEGFGHWIVIRHANGDVSIYGHMYSVLVSVGQVVKAGQLIADIGADGEATGPHLHFGVREGGMTGPYVDPVPWLTARGVSVGPYNPNA
jgi:murein DD-endopeptidase MepM/ murein hydrolase activator NlpD